jgi:hypothetical protein
MSGRWHLTFVFSSERKDSEELGKRTWSGTVANVPSRMTSADITRGNSKKLSYSGALDSVVICAQLRKQIPHL